MKGVVVSLLGLEDGWRTKKGETPTGFLIEPNATRGVEMRER